MRKPRSDLEAQILGTPKAGITKSICCDDRGCALRSLLGRSDRQFSVIDTVIDTLHQTGNAGPGVHTLSVTPVRQFRQVDLQT